MKKVEVSPDFSSLALDVSRTKIFEQLSLWQTTNQCKHHALNALVITLISTFIGVVAFMITWFEELLVEFKVVSMQRILTGSDDHLFAYTFYIVFSLACASIAALLTLYVAPKAVGSGIPELMGILNGVEIPNMFSWRLVGVKSIGVVLAVAATLCIGKEGPLAHIGACLAVLTIYLPFSALKQF